MPPTLAPTPDTIRRARVFWLQSQDDLKLARRHLRRRSYHDGSFLSMQAALNALSTVCRLHGHFMPPQHGLREMLGLCGQCDPRFDAVLAGEAALDTVPERNPFAPADPPEAAEAFTRSCLAEAEQVVGAVRGYLKEHRRRFFAP